MPAVDTDVPVRFLANDDEVQSPVARKVFARGPVCISQTVLLETAWVLRRSKGMDSLAIAACLTGLMGLDNVHVENYDAVALALSRVRQGLDLADSLHLASRPLDVDFLTFDRKLVRRAQRLGPSGIAEP